ncbi:MAG TPA: FAD-binding protein, partial [Longimicrobiales bacterium]|nr:FAD-binding protein [Longimicrobiales bacterium]
MKRAQVPVIVVGSGIAGLSFSLKVSEFADVLLVTKKDRAESNTNWARGGIAAVMGPDDDPALHVQDTLVAGAGLCHREVVESVVREG